MSQAEVRPTNFIRQIIDEDLNSGKHTNVHTRFPPEPNGFLHIGHAKSICLNFGIADDYQGQCNLRFDDTNPEKEDIDYVHAIQEDVKWLGFNWDGEVRYSSNYFDKLFEYAVELIQVGKAYVCFLNAEETREYRGTLNKPGKNSPYRETSIEENLALFNKMRDAGFADGECCLRAKIDMASSFMCMRDPVIYRIKRAHHHQTGDKWCIYPMYDFTHCISDAIEGISHSICTLEFQDNRRVYDWVLDNISIDCRPRQYEFSRLNIEYTMMSKRKLNALVTENHVSGWDDPRMPTIAGLRRRGYTAASIREFCKRIGVTKQINTIEMGMLEACIREDLEDSAPRAMAVLDPVKLVITNYPENQTEQLIAPAHPKLDMGSRTLPFSRELFIDRADFREEANKKYKRLVLGKEVRLRNAYIVRADAVVKDDTGNIIEIHCTYDDETLGKNPSDGRKAKGVIHWVSAADAVDAEVRVYDRLFKIEDPASVETLEEALNEESLVVIKTAKVEPGLVAAQPASAYQFEREGYFCADSKDSTADKLVFNRTVSLRG
ncbi:glutamine--tRNA ligase [Moritella viscosa]|uniref:Glutamine--tRNA ligase n=1 Tax=Moritella viscosa TaxID=80854 RepID=A0A1L0A1S2_9GAMM|nr:glutamine--tRNA ligase [Moritella viscosa]SGY95434.1 Glutaminyl-tRNA synthetase [Moritella viscosa]SGZ00818.1 Glutaminyl-tRNA synthetase [Moritella viscosa]SGZ07418.1 Glutaminyl-tRNA synthetase [Moritella viscosa]SGZ07534.1 Glutaminyl-tRNA synthetase [Moritella viscosa]SHO09891.1 Glutaminyl-tRNA synthetase [Moritella viscosa]